MSWQMVIHIDPNKADNDDRSRKSLALLNDIRHLVPELAERMGVERHTITVRGPESVA